MLRPPLPLPNRVTWAALTFQFSRSGTPHQDDIGFVEGMTSTACRDAGFSKCRTVNQFIGAVLFSCAPLQVIQTAIRRGLVWEMAGFSAIAWPDKSFKDQSVDRPNESAAFPVAQHDKRIPVAIRRCFEDVRFGPGLAASGQPTADSTVGRDFILKSLNRLPFFDGLGLCHGI